MTPTPRPAVTPAPTPTPAPKEVHLTESDNGRSVQLAKGDILVVSLYECCDSKWDYEAPRPDSGVLAEVENTTESAGGDLRRHVWRFRAAGQGATSVKLLYTDRPGDPPRQRWSADAQVTG